jgi:cobalt-precorrin-5B (C1)-methyltransferase
MTDAVPELREPDLPRTAKVRDRALRTGWTTGACAAAAAKAAAVLLAGDPAPGSVVIPLPQPFRGQGRVRFAVDGTEAGVGWAEAVVVKDAGDDPDVTHGARLVVHLESRPSPGIAYRAGGGVGTVTKPGLGLPVGGPAINPVPRRMIETALREVLDLEAAGVTCTISVPDGERMARKTTNARLGIVGGISILGTTGVVRPFSTASWLASVVQAVDVIAAQGLDTVVLSTGGRTERAAMRLLPNLPDTCFVEVGDFTGAALREAAERGVGRCVFVGMAGKLSKLAGGVLMTHYTRSKVDRSLLAELVAEAGAPLDLVEQIHEANTARHAYELWRAAGVDRAGDLLCEQVAANLARFTGGSITADVVLVDFDTLQIAGMSRGEIAGMSRDGVAGMSRDGVAGGSAGRAR